MSNENEDLLDALAVIIDLDDFDDDKFVYYPEDFREAISVFPSSMSYGQLNCVVPWESLESVLKIICAATRQQATTWSTALSNDECSTIENAVRRLLEEFRSHENSIDEGTTCPSFHKTTAAQGLAYSPEAEDAGRRGRFLQTEGLMFMNACMLRICESIRLGHYDV